MTQWALHEHMDSDQQEHHDYTSDIYRHITEP